MSRQVVVIWGGHATSKTTVCQTLRGLLPESKVNIVFGDLDNRFKGEVGCKRDNLTKLLQEDQRHIVFEGMRAPSGLWDIFLQESNLTLVLVLSNAKRMLASMTGRKESRGNTFTDKQKAYWSKSKLDYESKGRFINALKKLSDTYPDLVAKTKLRVVTHIEPYPDFSAWEPEIVRLYKELR